VEQFNKRDRIGYYHYNHIHCHDYSRQEHPLLHTQLHEEYCILFEEIFSDFLMNENISLQQFYSVISEQYTKENSFAKMLTSAIEFEILQRKSRKWQNRMRESGCERL
jgi:hypothetical protein